MPQTLNGQIALISGGLGDIGRAIALELARRGADVALGDIRAETEAESLLGELRQLGRWAAYTRVDVSDVSAVQHWIASVETSRGTPSLIVPNAAVVTPADVLDITPQQWTRDLRVNLDGAFFMAQDAAKRLVKIGRPGRIVFVGSWAAHAPHPHIPAYSASKAALRMVCQTMAISLAQHDILVNEVAPGYVDAGLSAEIWRTRPDLREQSRQQVPVNRLIHPREVAFQIAQLCEPDNRHITGSVVLIDGGLSLNRLPPTNHQPHA